MSATERDDQSTASTAGALETVLSAPPDDPADVVSELHELRGRWSEPGSR